MDSLSSLVYNAETRSQARMYLYRRLQEDSVLFASDAIFTTFINQYATGAVGDLAEIDSELASQYTYSPTVTNLLTGIDIQIQQLNDTLNYLSSLLGISTNVTDSLNNRIIQLDLQRQLIMAGVNGDRDLSIDLALQLNHSVSSTSQLPEHNMEIVNNYYLNFMQGGIETFKKNSESLFSIANQCPYQGGEAVFLARGLVELLNDTIVYNDAGVCLDNGIYRMGEKQNNYISYLLLPNPANSEVQVTMIKTDETISSIQVQELSGKLLWHKSYNDNLRSQKIITSNFAEGMYVIQLVSGKGITTSQKLVINH